MRVLFRFRRRNQKFAGKVYQPGDTIDSNDVQLPPWKWDVVKAAGIIEPADDPVVVRPVKDGRRICADCEFVANTPHGLTVHKGRAHKSSTTASA